MARRFESMLRVKPRDNLGDPEYWNRRFDDIDRRISSNEDGLEAIGGLTAYVEGLALNRLDLVLAPALDKITLVSEQGFLLAHSDSVVTLDTATTQTFVIDDAAERELFAPSPYLTIAREANMTDYCFAQLVDYDKVTGQLVVQPVHIQGNPGPFDDWVIYVGTAISQAVTDILDQTIAAKNTTFGYRNDAAASAAAALADKNTVAGYRIDTLAARDAAQLAATNAQTWDPTNYALITYVDSKVASLVNSAPTTLDTLNELATALGNDANFSTTVTAALGNRLRFDADAPLNPTQQAKATANLGYGTIVYKNVATAPEIKTNSGSNAITVDNAWTAAAWINIGNSGAGTLVIDGNNGPNQVCTLTGNVTVSFINMRSGQSLNLLFIQDATGGRTVSWNANFRFPDNVAPQIYTGASAIGLIYSGVYYTNGYILGAGWKIF
ncbi:tail fiber protein [Bradyrhizobium phage BDU-MI-1]|nr:tail fiber protein [Bradyrhizobium phage BDU-MI-1]